MLPIFTDGQLQRLRMPVLFVGGENDVMLDMAGAAARLETLLPQAEIHLLKDTGHMILNTPEYILPFLGKWR
jgi:pimeloyl-ACP methyl ester carboxylesterase